MDTKNIALTLDFSLWNSLAAGRGGRMSMELHSSEPSPLLDLWYDTQGDVDDLVIFL